MKKIKYTILPVLYLRELYDSILLRFRFRYAKKLSFLRFEFRFRNTVDPD